MSCYLAVWLKLISYAAVNKWCREEKVQGGKKHKGDTFSHNFVFVTGCQRPFVCPVRCTAF